LPPPSLTETKLGVGRRSGLPMIKNFILKFYVIYYLPFFIFAILSLCVFKLWVYPYFTSYL